MHEPFGLLADPVAYAALSAQAGSLRNSNGAWPVLGGIPVLVRDPAPWVAARRDALLAALFEAGRGVPADVQRVDALCAAAGRVPAVVVADDFLADEDAVVEPIEGPGAEPLQRLLSLPSLADHLLADLGGGPVLEVGCGAGGLTRRIEGHAVVAVDHSLRAVLRATNGSDRIGVVGEADALPVRSGAFGTVFAANLVDVASDPDRVVGELARAVAPGGRVVLTTPDPSLGVPGDDDRVVRLLAEAGLGIAEDEDGLPWLRAHSAREFQVFLVRRVVAEKPAR